MARGGLIWYHEEAGKKNANQSDEGIRHASSVKLPMPDIINEPVLKVRLRSPVYFCERRNKKPILCP
jgi:hypothetical protein